MLVRVYTCQIVGNLMPRTLFQISEVPFPSPPPPLPQLSASTEALLSKQVIYWSYDNLHMYLHLVGIICIRAK